MSSYHVLEKAVDNKTCRVAIHLPIPSTETTAGQALTETITYQDAIRGTIPKDDLGNPIYSDIPEHESKFPTEYAGLQNGELKERIMTFRFSSVELTNPQRRGEIENGNDSNIGVAQMLVEIQTPGSDLWNEILEPLEWWGYHRDL